MLLATQRASTCDIAYAPPEHVVNMDHPSALHKNVFVGRGVEGGGIQQDPSVSSSFGDLFKLFSMGPVRFRPDLNNLEVHILFRFVFAIWGWRCWS